MHPLQPSALLLSLLLAPVPSLAMLRCENMLIDKHSFDLSKLGGPHSVVTSQYDALSENHYNTTYTVDICQPLKKASDKKNHEQCPMGTRACRIQHMFKDGTDTDSISEVVAIAGGLENSGGSQFDYELTRLKTSDSNADSKKEGVRVVLKGGKKPLAKHGRPQKAVLEFLCDPDKTGDEGEWDAEDKYEKPKLRAREDKKEGEDDKEGDKDGEKDGDKDGEEDGDKDGEKDGDKGGDDDDKDDGDDEGDAGLEHQLTKDDSALIWESYGPEKDADVLRMTWYTKYACEKREDSEDDSDSSSHWGFFTWLIIVVFMGTASYLIFGSWLNYNRYGARGWDLLPHGDTIRDVPYLLKDWMRRVLNTVQGAGSRGGYSAV